MQRRGVGSPRCLAPISLCCGRLPRVRPRLIEIVGLAMPAKIHWREVAAAKILGFHLALQLAHHTSAWHRANRRIVGEAKPSLVVANGMLARAALHNWGAAERLGFAHAHGVWIVGGAAPRTAIVANHNRRQ